MRYTDADLRRELATLVQGNSSMCAKLLLGKVPDGAAIMHSDASAARDLWGRCLVSILLSDQQVPPPLLSACAAVPNTASIKCCTPAWTASCHLPHSHAAAASHCTNNLGSTNPACCPARFQNPGQRGPGTVGGAPSTALHRRSQPSAGLQMARILDARGKLLQRLQNLSEVRNHLALRAVGMLLPSPHQRQTGTHQTPESRLHSLEVRLPPPLPWVPCLTGPLVPSQVLGGRPPATPTADVARPL